MYMCRDEQREAVRNSLGGTIPTVEPKLLLNKESIALYPVLRMHKQVHNIRILISAFVEQIIHFLDVLRWVIWAVILENQSPPHKTLLHNPTDF